MYNLVVFDVDDVMWDLNDRVAKLKGIDPAKMTIFSVYDNPNLTEDERARIMDGYTDVRTFRGIVFIRPVVDLINGIYHGYPQYSVHIRSNCASRPIRNEKMGQLLNILDLPEKHIHLDMISMEKGHKKKELPGNMFIFVDDSPHNIVLGNAIHRVMPAKRYNDVLAGGCLGGFKIDRPENEKELVDTVMQYIKAGR